MGATDLLRVVVVDGIVVPDPRRRLPGRGAHLHFGPECLASAERRSAFRRAFRSSGPFDASKLREFLQGNFSAAPDVRQSTDQQRTPPHPTGSASSSSRKQGETTMSPR